MLSELRWLRSCLVVGLTTICLVFSVAGSAGAVDEKMLERMEQVIKQQQAQIEAQAKALEKLQKQVEALQESAVKEATEAAREEVAKASTRPDVVVNKGGEKVALKIYGQVNRAALISDDGDSSDYYFVDNSNSSSRVGLIASAKVNDDLEIGGRFEFDSDQNKSDKVNQDDKSNVGDNKFRDRWIDAQVTSKTFGKLYLGKGSTASDGTSEVDLSGTSVVGYSSVTDMAGGIFFYDSASGGFVDTDPTGAVSFLKAGDVFNNFDGLGRDDRIRYDTPEFFGFTASASALSGNGGDVALKYAAQWGDFKFAAGAAYANPSSNGSYDDQYNGSASVLHASGINLTVAGGQRNFDTSGRDDATFYYGKLGYRRQFFELGESRFSVDYGRYDDVAQNNDEAETWGFQIVQDFAKWGSEYYLGYRNYDLDRSFDNVGGNPLSLDDIDVLMTGVRVKF